MPTYYYACVDCEVAAVAAAGRQLLVEEYEALVLFETAHKVEPTTEELAEARICPRCGGSNSHKSFQGTNIIGYVRGNGYLDRAGCYRDMHLHHLTGTDATTGESLDQYAEHRQPGEVEDLKMRLKRAGQHNPNTKHYVPPADMQQAVTRAVLKPDPPSDS